MGWCARPVTAEVLLCPRPNDGNARGRRGETLLRSLLADQAVCNRRRVLSLERTSPQTSSLKQTSAEPWHAPGCRVIWFHDLRQTHATILLKTGQPVKVVSERLRHASPTFTLSVYQHVVPGMQAAAAKRFSALLRGSDLLRLTAMLDIRVSRAYRD